MELENKNEKNAKFLAFPKGFFWGASTASHQIEGGNVNDWSEWEKSPKRMAELKKKNKNPEEYISGKACNSYELFDEDLKRIKEFNLNAYRFSIEWSRVEPEEGKWNEEAIDHYKNVVKKLKENNVEPFVTVWHWTIPLWARDRGGWSSKKILDPFSRFAEKMASELKDVKFWITLNEPEVYAGQSYLIGIWPPQKNNPFVYVKVIRNLIKAHNNIFHVIKKINLEAKIGIANPNIYFEAYKNRFVNIVLKKIVDWWWNFYFLDKTKNGLDFIGLNHYHHSRINYGFHKNENKIVSDFGWELYPESIYHALMDLKKYNKPIYVTEHGLADAKDRYREWFIVESLKNVHRAIDEGANARGYLHWSLLDNFEWAEGFTKKFGLCEVDFKTFKRAPRPSAKIYAEICKNNGFMLK